MSLPHSLYQDSTLLVSSQMTSTAASPFHTALNFIEENYTAATAAHSCLPKYSR